MKRWRRAFRFWLQRLTRGWDDSDTWSLHVTMAKWLLPRLRRFAAVTNGTPGDMTEEEWRVILAKMIVAFEYMASDTEQWETLSDPGYVTDGLKLFAEHYRSLWW